MCLGLDFQSADSKSSSSDFVMHNLLVFKIYGYFQALSNSKWELRKISYLRSRFRQILCQLLDIQVGDRLS